MISAGELRNGVTMEYEGEIYSVLEFQHVNPVKGAAFVRTRLKNIKTGAVVEKTFRPTEKCPKHTSTEWICSTCIMTVNCITS